MKDGPDLSRIGNLVGDPARANMLTALMDGGSLTASELALEAGVTAQTASSHLGKLMEGGLLSLSTQGRHRYYALSGPQVAAMLEAIMGVAASVGPKRARPGPRDATMREARICYDHLAGNHAVAMLDRLLERGILTGDGDRHPARTIGAVAFRGDRHRHRGFRQAAAAGLPRLPRLERQALASRRRARRGDPGQDPGREMGAARGRQPRHRVFATRQGGVSKRRS